jgi:drug/metabolite transporter (DMT)-like permease
MSGYRDAALFVFLSAIWGTSFMAIKVGLDFMPPVLFAAFRYDITGLLMLVYAFFAVDYWLPRSRADYLTLLVETVLIIALYNAFLFIGETGVSSGVAAILIGMNPILTTGFSRLFLPEERLSLVGTGGLLLGFVGVGLVVFPRDGTVAFSDLVSPGFVLLAAASVALGSVLVQRLDGGISSEGMVAWSTALGAVLLHAISVAMPSESFGAVEVTTEGVLAVVYLAVVASAIGYVLYFRLLERLGAIEINFVSYTVPVFAAISGWLVLNEVLDALSVVGFLVILLGFALLKRRALRAELRTLQQRYHSDSPGSR